jgi:hypothetical protein
MILNIENLPLVSIVVYDKTGLPQSVQRYARSYLSEKRLVGKVELPMLDVTWEDS